MGRVFAALLWLITILTVWMFVSKKWWLPPAITEHGPAYDRQFLVTIIIVGIAFAGAQVALGYMLWRYGARRDSSRGDCKQSSAFDHLTGSRERQPVGIE